MSILERAAHPPPRSSEPPGLAEPAAFDAAFDRHGPAIHRYVAARVGRDLAQDVVAEAFARAFRERSRFDPARGTVQGWLYGFAVNALREHRRAERRRIAGLARLEAEFGPAEAVAAPDGVAFLDVVERLDADDRDLILLLAWGGLTYAEIAQATGRTLPSVRARLHRIRTRLARELREEP